MFVSQKKKKKKKKKKKTNKQTNKKKVMQTHFAPLNIYLDILLLLLNYFKFLFFIFFIVIIIRCQKCEFINDKNIILGKIPTWLTACTTNTLNVICSKYFHNKFLVIGYFFIPIKKKKNFSCRFKLELITIYYL